MRKTSLILCVLLFVVACGSQPSEPEQATTVIVCEQSTYAEGLLMPLLEEHVAHAVETETRLIVDSYHASTGSFSVAYNDIATVPGNNELIREQNAEVVVKDLITQIMGDYSASRRDVAGTDIVAGINRVTDYAERFGDTEAFICGSNDISRYGEAFDENPVGLFDDLDATVAVSPVGTTVDITFVGNNAINSTVAAKREVFLDQVCVMARANCVFQLS